MKSLESGLRTDKRTFFHEQLSLTPEEATKFWPIYDAHQAALSAFNKRRLDNIIEYARHYNAGSLDDASATRIAEEALSLEKDEAVQMERSFHKLKKAIPAVKAARYLQVENKLRAIVRFEQAAQVPVVE
jgi:Spy/CpxP family protein refolding chaperone